MCYEFGIITAPADAELPDSVYGMPELQNLPNDGTRHRSKRRRVDRSNYDSNTENNQNTPEDEDGGYDCDSDMNED